MKSDFKLGLLIIGSIGTIIIILPLSLFLSYFFIMGQGCATTTDDYESVDLTILDKDMNLYLFGKTGSIDFPFTNNLTNSYSKSPVLFLMKYSPSGILLWSTKYSKSDWDQPTALKVDNNGNVIIAGTWKPADPSFTSFFITKFSPNGEVLFEKTLGGQEFDDNPQVVISQSNQIYLFGRITNQYPTGQNYDQSEHQLLVKLHENGTLIYSQSYDSARVESITIDAQENIYFTSIESFGIYDEEQGTFPEHYLYLTKIAPNGSTLYHKYINEVDILEYSKIAIDNADNIIITGVTRSANYTLMNSLDNQYMSTEGATFVEKIANNGTKVWNRVLPLVGNNLKIPFSLTLTENNDIIIKGTLGSNYQLNKTTIYSVQVSETGATILNSNTVELSPWSTWITNIERQPDGTYYIVGTAHDPVNVLGNDLQIKGSRDIFVIKFDANNIFLNGLYIGGKGDPMNICY